WKTGYKWLMRLLPPIVVAPVIMVIGLGLAATAVDIAMNVNGEYSFIHFTAALVTLFAAIIFTVYFKYILSAMPILLGLIVGYIYSAIVGIVDFTAVRE
ncbi:solute carrier family 23 protein, partial [Robertmurraya sp. DFI.2.37]|uniref:solute carrier family 23 protein n=1 Tax=Robertmurraya sp. DFI.2.37 TaxID=3031819 RepID=UPI0023DBDA04